MKPAVFVLVFVVATALGRAETIGVDDLAEHIEAIVKQRPRDAAAHYTLGRAQAIAVERRIDKVEIADKLVAGKVPTLADDAQQPPATLPVAGEQITKFLNGAIVHVTKAVELARDEPRYRLAMAQLLDRAAPSAIDVDVLPRVVATPPPIMNAGQTERTTKFIEELNDDAKRDAAITELRKHLDEAAAMLHAHRKDGGDAAKQAVASLLEQQWKEQAIAAYLQVYQTSVKRELPAIQAKKLSFGKSMTGQGLDGWIRLVEQRPGGPRGVEQRMLPQMKAVRDAMGKMSP